MITSKQIYPTLIDVFYGDKGFRQQEWIRCSYSKYKGWRIAEWPVFSNKAEHEYGCINSISVYIPLVHKYLMETYGTPTVKPTRK